MTGRLKPEELLMWVDDLPEVNDYLLWKRRERARAILSDLSRSDVDWRAQLSEYDLEDLGFPCWAGAQRAARCEGAQV